MKHLILLGAAFLCTHFLVAQSPNMTIAAGSVFQKKGNSFSPLSAQVDARATALEPKVIVNEGHACYTNLLEDGYLKISECPDRMLENDSQKKNKKSTPTKSKKKKTRREAPGACLPQVEAGKR